MFDHFLWPGFLLRRLLLGFHLLLNIFSLCSGKLPSVWVLFLVHNLYYFCLSLLVLYFFFFFIADGPTHLIFTDGPKCIVSVLAFGERTVEDRSGPNKIRNLYNGFYFNAPVSSQGQKHLFTLSLLLPWPFILKSVFGLADKNIYNNEMPGFK